MATAHFIQAGAKQRGLDTKIFVIEKESRLGGKIRTENADGWICEHGPLGYVDNKPFVSQVIADLGLGASIVKADDAAAKRYVYVDGKLQLVPLSPPAFIASSLLSLRGKIRAVRELWTKPAVAADESIAEFARRHLGTEVADKLIAAMVVGVFAGDSELLSIKSAFPVMLGLESEGDGSLIRAQMRRQKAKKSSGQESASGPKSEGIVGSSGKLTSFSPGMNHMIDALKARFDGEIKSGNGAQRVSLEDGGYSVDLADGFKLPVDAVVLAAPAYAAGAILRDLDEALSDLIAGIPYVPVNIVLCGYPGAGFEHDLDGFGFVIPKREKRDILGTLWNTSIFPGQAPAGKVALRTMVGGGTNPEAVEHDDRATLALVQRELRTTMGIKQDPEFTKIIRHRQAIPQYVIGHGDRLDQIDEKLSAYQGLFLTGNAFRGVSFNDCVINAGKTAERVLDLAEKT